MFFVSMVTGGEQQRIEMFLFLWLQFEMRIELIFHKTSFYKWTYSFLNVKTQPKDLR